MDLSDFFQTKSQANDFAVRLNAIIDQMYTTQFDLEKALSAQFSVVKVDAILKLMRENHVDSGSITSVQDFFKKVQDTLNTIPTVSLTLAFEPTYPVLKRLSQWFVANTNKQVLFDIAVDTSLIAGAQLTYNGTFKDYSISSVFHDMLSNMLASIQKTTAKSPPSPIHQSTEHITMGR